ncbi:hypothetical protein SAMN04487992_102249 [Cellulophaga baltica]|uniref:Uncharacterized protein n=1 Tax=Cellulophaga baltica TaxID=76594 RepID=A0A1G7ED32_9FLAO|nr:hypothetical protein SAMN04487992_102249 [Cellulophaga baltica]
MNNFFCLFLITTKTTMIENIRSMFSKMNDKTRQEALDCLMAEFNQESNKFLRQNWIIGGRIPEEYQEKIVHIFQNLLRTQIYRVNEIKVNF